MSANNGTSDTRAETIRSEEASLLAGMVYDATNLHNGLAALADTDLETPDAQKCLRAIRRLVGEGKVPDLPAIQLTASRLELGPTWKSAGWLATVSELVSDRFNFDLFLGRVKERVARRMLDRIGRGLVADAADQAIEPDVAIVRASEEIRAAASVAAGTGRGKSMLDLLVDVFDKAIDPADRNHLATDIGVFDYQFRGIPGKGLTYLGARPGVGKTALAAQIARFVAKSLVRVEYYTMERDAEDLATVIAAQEARIPLGRFLAKNWDDNEHRAIQAARKRIGNSGLSISDRTRINPNHLRAWLHEKPPDERPGLLIVDYIGLMDTSPVRSKNTTREQEMAWLSRELKSITLEFGIAVLACAQLNRASTTRGDSFPRLTDLRESGSLEQDADMVLFIHRPAALVQDSEAEAVPSNEATLIIAKNRRGPVGTVQLLFDGPLQTFSEHIGRL